MNERNERILADLEARGLEIGGVIGSNMTGKLQVLMYDHKGLVTGISEKTTHVALYSKESVETRGMREIFTVSGVKNTEES